MQDDDEIRTRPPIPAPRRPEPDAPQDSGAPAAPPSSAPVPSAPPSSAPPSSAPIPSAPIPSAPVPPVLAASGPAGSARFAGSVRWAMGALLVVLLLVGIAVVAARGKTRRATAVAPATAASATVPPAPMPTGSTPYESAVLALRAQVASVGAGDEAQWMSVVDPGNPALVERYRGVFRTLRALGVTRFKYDPGIGKPDTKDRSAVTFPTRVWYCFGPDTCRGDRDPAEIQQILTMKAIGGRWMITAVADKPDPSYAEPTPWQSGKLVFVRGARVTVAAEPSEAGRLAQILPLAEKAAAANDPFAKTLLAEQTRYRVYLAGEKQWKTWYGGVDDDWVLGLSVPISAYGNDVVLRMSALHDVTETQVTLQHEFGHVITLMGAATYRTRNRWLSEGVAEYIGWWPRPATKSDRMPSVRSERTRRGAASMIPVDPGAKASLRAGDAYYGRSHLGVDCLAQKYSQDKMFRFVRLVLLRDETYDSASRDAFGLPFTKVDHDCAAWIRERT
jgi:hypothetical protein